MNSKVFLLSIFTLVILVGLPACTLFGQSEPPLSPGELAQTIVAETMEVEHRIQTIIASTLAAQVVDTEVPAQIETPEALTLTPEPTITPSPTITLTPTPDKPMVSVNVNTNCRLGPGQQYGIVGSLSVGEQAEVVGVAETGNYWVIRNPRRAGECWLWGQYATVVGNTSGLPRRTPPPTPTPIFTPTPVYNWTGTWVTEHGVPGMMGETYIIEFTQTNGIVNGFFDIGGLTVVNMSGTLSSDNRTLTGTYMVHGHTGVFTFQLVSPNQFVGNKDNRDYRWCGHRGGAGLPSPCMGP